MITTSFSPDLLAALTAPFPLDQVEVKPGAVRQDGTAAIALAYADWRTYAERLDTVVGPGGWSIQLIPWGETRLIARLTIMGITKDASGEGEAHDDNCGTIAEAQAKKRACAEFGLGRYLYQLPHCWGEGQGDRKSFRFHEPRRIIERLYAEAGLLSAAAAARASEPLTTTHQSATSGRMPDPTRIATAATPASGHAPATPNQRRAILTLLGRCASLDRPAQTIDHLGNQVGLAHLSSITNIPDSLPKQQASMLISGLQTLLQSAAP